MATFVGSSTNSTGGATSLTVNYPAGIVAGDVLIAVMNDNDNLAAITPPGGWTVLDSGPVETGSQESGVWYLVYAGSGTSATWTITQAQKATACIVAYRGVDNTTPVSIVGTRGTQPSASTDLTVPGITTLSANQEVLTCFTYKASSVTNQSTPLGMTLRASVLTTGGGATVAAIFSETIVSPGATGGRTSTYDIASSSGYALMIALLDDTGPPPAPPNMKYGQWHRRMIVEPVSPPDMISALSFPAYVIHRGGANEQPENTLASYRETAPAHLSAILDCDVQLNASNALVLMHDTTVDRTAALGETGNVSTYTNAQWATLTVKYPSGLAWVYASYLNDLLVEFPDRVFHIEPKTSGTLTAFLAVMNAMPGLKKRVIGNSFSQSQVLTMASNGLYAIQYGTTFDYATLSGGGAWGIGLAAGSLTSQIVTDAHAAGLKIAVYNVNSISSRNNQLALGADIILTDEPSTVIP